MHTHIYTWSIKHTATSNTGGLYTGLIAGIVVVCAVVILLTFLAGCGVGVIVHVVHQKKSKQLTSMHVYVVCVGTCMILAYKHAKPTDQKIVCIHVRPV